jgi:ankyrin repeat protein
MASVRHSVAFCTANESSRPGPLTRGIQTRRPRCIFGIQVILVIAIFLVPCSVLAKEESKNTSADVELIEACRSGDSTAVERLLKSGARVGCRDDKYGGTPLHWAAFRGRRKVVAVLLREGAEVNTTNNDGRTPLMLAAGRGHDKVVQMLLDNGADATSVDTDGRAAVDYASLKGYRRVTRLMRSYAKKRGLGKMAGSQGRTQGSDQSKDRELIKALRAGDLDHVKRLLDRRGDVNYKDPEGWTALMEAANKGYGHVVTSLLDRGAEVNAKNKHGFTALLCAAYKGQTEVMKLLLERGADPNTKGYQGWTALVYASINGHIAAIELLLAKGAHVNTETKTGLTALDWAEKEKKREAVRVLRRHGGRPGSLRQVFDFLKEE